MPLCAATSSTEGVAPLASSSRVAATRAVLVRAFWFRRPVDSYGTAITIMVLQSHIGGDHERRSGRDEPRVVQGDLRERSCPGAGVPGQTGRSDLAASPPR